MLENNFEIDMKTRVLLATCLFAFLFSCSSGKEQKEVVVQSVKHEVLMGDECMIGITREIELLNDSISVVINSRSEDAFQILHHAEKKAVNLGKIGQGPDDFLLLFFISMDGDDFSFYDVNKNRYSTIQLNTEDDSWQVKHDFKLDSLTHLHIRPIADNRYVSTGIYEDCTLMVLDEDGMPLKKFGEWPYKDEEEKKVSGKTRAMVYQGELVAHPSGNKVAHIISMGDIFYFYEVSPDGDLVLKSKQEKAYANYNHANGAHYQSSLHYSVDACTTEDYVYMLYSGRSLKEYGLKCFHGNLVLVYDWDGNLVKKLQLDVDVKHIAVSKDNRKLYAIADLPDPVLVVFEI